MSRTVYVNGDFLPEENAKISVFDRGFLFADGVYEVTTVIGGKLLDFDGHMARLKRSLGELDMNQPAEIDTLLEIHKRLIEENSLVNGLIYLQVTRGAADRDFAFPPEDTPMSVVLFTQTSDPTKSKLSETGARVIVVPDNRWARRDIKTVQLLYPSLAKMAAKKAGADDAWMEEDGYITEGSSNNAWIVTEDGTLVTRDLSHSILHGITRKAVLKCAELLQMKVEERPFTKEEAANAREAFITSASSFVTPVIEIDGNSIGEGKPGPTAGKLREIYMEEALKTAV
ncbi:MAG: D-amino-acid transaminase [Rhizobiaceae bacterium]|jgi:D-alanine transaminase|nr:D-amino-acid transaminase [Rhizobiaceae bacterium]